MVFLSSCQQKAPKDFYYPSRQAFDRFYVQDTVKLSSYSNFDEFQSRLWKLDRKDPQKNPIILIEHKGQRFFIKYTIDWGYQPHITKLKNLIGISKDSLYKWEQYHSIDSLEYFLKKDLFNNGMDNQFADNSKSLKIQFLHPHQETMQDLEDNIESQIIYF